MASNEDSALDNTQLHVPKDFSSASNNTILTKDNAGLLSWQDDRLRTTHFVRVGGFMSKSATSEFAPSYASGTQHSFDTVVSFSSGTTLSDAQEAVAHSQLYCTRDGYVNAFQGVIAINSTRSVEIRLYKGTPVDESSAGFTLTELGDTVTETGEGNTTPNLFGTGSLGASSSFSAGDVLIVTLKPTVAAATTVRFNSTIEVVYTA